MSAGNAPPSSSSPSLPTASESSAAATWRPSLAWLLAWCAFPTLLAASAMEFLPTRGVTLEVLATTLVVAMAVGILRARHELLAPHYLVRVPILMALTVSVAAAFPLIGDIQPRNPAVFGTVGPTLMGWAIFFWLLGARDPSAGTQAPAWEPPRWAIPALLGASVLVIAVTHWLAVGRHAIVSDEVIYLLQSRWMWNRDFAWHVDRDLVPFLSMRKLGETPSGGLYGQYTPGWPLVLALFDLIGLRWWSGVILGTASVWATYRLGTLLYGRAAGVLAGALLVVQPWFLVLHAGYMAHAATILCTALAAIWLLEGESATGWGRTWRWLATGAAIALSVTVRSLTGVALGASLALWVLLRRRLSVRELVRCAATVVVGALPLAAWFLYYNWATNGDPLRVSYQALHGTGYNLGFGTRGFTGFDEQMRRVLIPTVFTPRLAVIHLLQMVASINLGFLPYALLAPALALFAAHRHRPRWAMVAAFAILPVLYFFYWGSAIRFYSEYFPFLLAWVAAGCVAVMRQRPRVGAGLVAATVAGSVLLNIPGRWDKIQLSEPWVRSDYTGNPARFAAYDTLEQLQRERGKLLVFVQERVPRLDILIDRLYLYNMDGLDGGILVVRDLGARNAQLIERFPDRVPYLLRDNGRERAATITPIARGTAAR